MHKEQMTVPNRAIPWDIVRCPTCLGCVERQDNVIVCSNPLCHKTYPLVESIPVLINEESSVFSFADFAVNKTTFFQKRGRLVEWLNQNVPSISHNLAAKQNYKKLSELALTEMSSARILVIGGSVAGQGFEMLSENSALELVETDVSFGPRVTMICDGHDLPFVDGCFDVVIAQAVLEHVVDPFRCVSEFYRVLRDDGLIYAETPFMQQVHGGKYDFMRFTYRGHRRLFRNFEEIHAGIIGGPGMALAWSWQYFLRSFGRSTRAQMYLAMLGRLTAFYLKYFDYLFKRAPAAYDSASGFYFMGRKSKIVLSDKDLVRFYTVP
ncbi:methyltransferase domain-containing protein [Sulfuricella sp.]|uniref:methyltransferase domain-containing protein n=1 Tax=Sulfuricella sp. TaxID=2099377 RepID=UPI002C30F96C|nr:methyltransferase domain-containing protein [Sulfuricella sp.]HUX65237.1 methyltransferase domain-containing protein [Sulfuricella sp.]